MKFTIRDLDSKSAAFLVIDMQNDFLHKDGYLAKTGEIDTGKFGTLITRIKGLAESMRRVSVPVIYIQTMYEPDYADIGIPAIRWRPGCGELTFLVKGTRGAEIVDELKPVKGDYVIEAKCYDKFLHTPLELLLHNKGVRTLILTGITTNVCVETTVRSATGRGFEAVVVSDATSTQPEKEHDAAIRRIANFFGAVMNSKEVESLLRHGGD